MPSWGEEAGWLPVSTSYIRPSLSPLQRPVISMCTGLPACPSSGPPLLVPVPPKAPGTPIACLNMLGTHESCWLPLPSCSGCDSLSSSSQISTVLFCWPARLLSPPQVSCLVLVGGPLDAGILSGTFPLTWAWYLSVTSWSGLLSRSKALMSALRRTTWLLMSSHQLSAPVPPSPRCHLPALMGTRVSSGRALAD